MNEQWIELEQNNCYEYKDGNRVVKLETPIKTGCAWRVSMTAFGQRYFMKNFMQEGGLEDAKAIAIKMVGDYLEETKKEFRKDNQKYFGLKE